MAPPSHEDQVEEWQERSAKLAPTNMKEIEGPLAELDAHLTLRSHIVGYSLTDADTTVWKAIKDNKIAANLIKQGRMINLTRWYRYIEEAYPDSTTALVERPKPKEEEGGNYEIGLQDTENGVVTRFPPEPSWVTHKVPWTH